MRHARLEDLPVRRRRGDVDNDGDLDVILAGSSGLVLYENQTTASSWKFVQDNQGITGTGDGESVAFADYDRDGDLDVLVNDDNGNELWANCTSACRQGPTSRSASGCSSRTATRRPSRWR